MEPRTPCCVVCTLFIQRRVKHKPSVRGIGSDSDVKTLRKLFPVMEELHIHKRNLNNVKKLHECVVNKTLEMQSIIMQQKSKLILLTQRFRIRLSPERTLAAFDGWSSVRPGSRPPNLKYVTGQTALKSTSTTWT